MKVDVIQTTFTGGEFGSSLLGRTDIASYANAVAIAQNFVVRPFGSIASCPGTQYINACKTGGSTSLTGVHLIPFVFSVTDSYIIEVGVGYFRFYNNGAIVVSPGTTPYEVAHKYAAADITSIQYCQNHDVIYLAHKNYPPATLTRLGATSWVLADFAFTGGPFQPINITSTQMSASGTSSGATVTITTSAAVFTVSTGVNVGHVNTFWSLGATLTSATTGLAVQGYFQITAVTNPSTATAVIQQTLTSGASSPNWSAPSWSYPSGWPARCCFYQSRLFFARTDTEPQTVWGSGTFTFTNFAVNGGNPADALNLQMSATEGNDIKWLYPMNDLICGTYGGEFSISAGLNTGNPLTPASVSVIQQTSWGSEAYIPVKIGNFAYYVQRYAQKLREIAYQWTSANYKSVDKTILSPQINGGGFIDIAFQQNPHTTVWLVCSNGTIATMTREVDQEVQGWSRQVTSGSFFSIASIPSQAGAYDEVWTIVTRTINGTSVNYVEKFASPILPTQGNTQTIQQDKLWYVHCGLNYNAFTAVTSTSISIGAGYNSTSSTVVITSSAGYFSAGNVGRRLRAVDAYDNILGEINITGYTSSTIVVGTVEYAFSSTTYSTGYWGVSVQTISGLNHLEQQTVSVLADGGVDYPAKVVSNGSITLGYDYFVVTVGLPYTQKIVTLPVDAGSSRGTAVGKKQRISEIAFKLNNSYTGFQIGGAAGTNLTKFQFRNPLTNMNVPPPLYTGTLANISFSDDYQYGAQMMIQNTDPLPIEILSITKTLETFDK